MNSDFNILRFISDVQIWFAMKGRDFEKEEDNVHMGMTLEANPIEVGNNSHMNGYIEYLNYHQKKNDD